MFFIVISNNILPHEIPDNSGESPAEGRALPGGFLKVLAHLIIPHLILLIQVVLLVELLLVRRMDLFWRLNTKKILSFLLKINC